MDWMTLAGSLAAVFALAGIAWLLGMGRTAGIGDEDQAKAMARDAQSGFHPVSAIVGSDGEAALAIDAGGALVLVRRHGAQFAARYFPAPPPVQAGDDGLQIATGERIFGTITIKADARTAADWARRIQAAAPAPSTER